MPAPTQPTPTSNEQLLARIAALESELAEERARVEKLTAERDQLRASYERLRLELELFRKRIFVAQAERVDTRQLELEFAGMMVELTKLDEELTKELEKAEGEAGKRATGGKERPKPTGRRDLKATKLPKERIEIADPVLEALVARGTIPDRFRWYNHDHLHSGLGLLTPYEVHHGLATAPDRPEVRRIRGRLCPSAGAVPPRPARPAAGPGGGLDRQAPIPSPRRRRALGNLKQPPPQSG